MRKLRLGLVALVIIAAAVLVPVPAQADHAWDGPHWRQDTYPAVTTPGCYYNWCDLIADAAYYWQDRGYYKGFTPPLPRQDWPFCEPRSGYINVCFKDRGDPALQGNVGLTHNFSRAGDPAHSWGSIVFVCGNCGNYEAQRTMRHEMGHALGLGHTPDTNCVMNDPAYVLGETCSHDRGAMEEMYSWRNHPI